MYLFLFFFFLHACLFLLQMEKMRLEPSGPLTQILVQRCLLDSVAGLPVGKDWEGPRM